MHLRTRSLCSADIAVLTGMDAPQFGELVRRIWMIRPDSGRGRPWGLSFPDRVLLVATYLHTNLTTRQLGVLFSVSQSQIERVIQDITPVLSSLLGPPPTDRRELWVVDGTLIPTRDHTRTALCKNYRRSVNVQVVCRRRDRRVVFVGEAWPGNRHDSVVFRATVPAAVAGHPRLIGDGGYQGVTELHTGAQRRRHEVPTGASSRMLPGRGSESDGRQPSTCWRSSRCGRACGIVGDVDKASRSSPGLWRHCTTSGSRSVTVGEAPDVPRCGGESPGEAVANRLATQLLGSAAW